MNTVQNYIVEKFEAFSNSRNITLLATPTMCRVIIPASTKGKTQHMAAPAEKNGIPGFLINLGDKKLTFFSATEALCKPLKDGSTVKGNARLHRSKSGITFTAI